MSLHDSVVIEGEVNLLSQIDGDPAVVLANTPIPDGSIKLNKIQNVINPDLFNGTDSEKLALAINSLTYGGIVLLGRDYTLTSNVIITRNSNVGRVIVRPLNGTATINCGAYEFGGEGASDGKTGGIQFEGIRFTGTGNLIDGYYLIRIFFENCYFAGFNHLVYSSNAHQNNTRFLQTIYFITCIIRQINGYIIDASTVNNIATKLNDIRITGSILEWSYGVICGGWWFGVYINDNAIEGFTGNVPLITGMNLSLAGTVKNNYFEQNNATTIDMSSYAVGNTFNIDISNNIIVETSKASGQVILLPLTNVANGTLQISNNTIRIDGETTAVGIYVDDSVTSQLVNVNVMGNLSTIHDTNSRLLNTKALNSLYSSELFKIKYVTDQTAGNTVTLNMPVTLNTLTSGLARCAVAFPFAAQNTSYSVEVSSLNVNDLGNVAANTSVYQKVAGGVVLQVTGTFTSWRTYVGTILMKVTFA